MGVCQGSCLGFSFEDAVHAEGLRFKVFGADPKP